MRSSLAYGALLQASLDSVASASPAPTPRRVFQAEPLGPQVTGSPVENSPSRTEQLRRDLIGDVKSDIGSILGGLGSDLPSWVASGIPNFFQGFPTGDAVVSSLGLNDAQVSALPTQVLNLDPYANWTESGWNVRFHGNVYKQPNTSTSDLNRLANIFLVDTSVEDLPQDQADRARNVTASIFVIQQGNVSVAPIHLDPAASQGSSGEPGGGGAVTPSGGNQTINLPYNTTVEGDFDVFVPINGNGLMNGNETDQVQRLNTHVEGASIGNSTAYLVPTTGLTVVSDIDG
jgi:hypothetical protein